GSNRRLQSSNRSLQDFSNQARVCDIVQMSGQHFLAARVMIERNRHPGADLDDELWLRGGQNTQSAKALGVGDVFIDYREPAVEQGVDQLELGPRFLERPTDVDVRPAKQLL